MKLPAGSFLGSQRAIWCNGGFSISITAYESHGAQPWHSHENPTIFMVLTGHKYDQGPNWGWHMGPMDLVFRAAGEDHHTILASGQMTGINVELGAEWLAAHELEPQDMSGYSRLDSALLKTSLLRLAVNASRSRTSAEDWLAASEELLRAGLSSAHFPQKRRPRWMALALDYMHQNAGQHVSLSGLARELGLHPVYLARAFREINGCSTSDYLRKLRILRAVGRHAEKADSLAASAHEAGFADQSHFGRAVRRDFNCRPSELAAMARFQSF